MSQIQVAIHVKDNQRALKLRKAQLQIDYPMYAMVMVEQLVTA